METERRQKTSPSCRHAWTDAGIHPVIVTAFNDTYPAGVSATVTVRVIDSPSFYVDASSAHPEAPYTTWNHAASTIQDAVDACGTLGAMILVTNGVYSAGSRAVEYERCVARVAVMKPVVLQSVKGPDVTKITGRMYE